MTERVSSSHPDDAHAGLPQRAVIPPEERPHVRIEQPSSRPGEPGTQIEVFTGAVRISGPFFRIEVQGCNFGYEAREDRTVLSGTGADDRRLLFGVRSDGAVLFRADPVTPQAPQTRERPQTSPSEADTASGPPSTPHRPPESPSETPPPPAAAAANGSADEAPAPDTQTDTANGTDGEPTANRVQYTGRLGRDPSFRTTASGALVAKFPLAVHRDDGHTTWHTVLVFGERAAQLRNRVEHGELAQGREVDVVGYLHTTERPSQSGEPRTVQQVHAVAIKKR